MEYVQHRSGRRARLHTRYRPPDAGAGLRGDEQRFAIEQVAARVGDCALDGTVSVDEVITLVNIPLGTNSIVECGSGDFSHDGQITIDEIITAVNHALRGCA